MDKSEAGFVIKNMFQRFKQLSNNYSIPRNTCHTFSATILCPAGLG